MTSLLNFIKIYQLVHKLFGGDTQTDKTDRRTDRQTGDLISLSFLFKESRIKIYAGHTTTIGGPHAAGGARVENS
jgi:hypothetical protein